MTDPTNDEVADEEVLAIEREIMAAIRLKDAAVLQPMLAGDFCYRTHFGAETDKAGFLQSVTSSPFEILSLHGEELNVNIYGDTAVLTGVQIAEARPPEGEKEESVVAFTDVFVRRDGRWLLVLAYGVELPSELETLTT
ncbi:MAG TPA: nuclear transport factor 2 family protein [Pyrinomonadaceae bacterium]|jgi:ketosteroid isomerase-like protein|nr:nuclear transport factor 2 family protein [Pyrinomonadaceae bacterium]